MHSSLTSEGRLSRRRRFILTSALALTLVVAASAGSSEPALASAREEAPTLTFAIAAFSATAFAPEYLAQTLGYYEQMGVNVRFLDNAGAQVSNFVASGQADLGAISVAGPAFLSRNGRSTKIIYAITGGASGGCLVGGPSVTKVSQLAAKRIGILGGGSSTAGFGSIYNSYFKLGADLVPFGTNPAMFAALAAGNIQAAVQSCDQFSALIANGSGHVLVDTRDAALRRKIIGPDYPEGSIFGLTENLANKRTAVVAALRAIDLALRYMRTHTPAEVAAALRRHPGFQTIPMDTLTSITKGALTYSGLNNGVITPSVWKIGLKGYATWGLGLQPDEPALAYDRLIDMSYLNLALDRNRTKLTGSIAPRTASSLRPAAGLGAGLFTITVKDRSATDGFVLTGPGISRKTAVKFKGIVTWKAYLSGGTYTFGSIRNPKDRHVVTIVGS